MEPDRCLPQAPPGWSVMEEKGRLVYLTSHPSVKIQSVSSLKEYHRKGRYQTVRPEDLIFSRKKLKLDHQLVHPEPEDFPHPDIAMEHQLSVAEDVVMTEKTGTNGDLMDCVVEKHFEVSNKNQDRKVEKQKEKIKSAVANLTIDSKIKIDHNEILIKSARKLNSARLMSQSQNEKFDLQMLKSELCQAQDEAEMAKCLWKVPFFRMKFSSLLNSSYLEQLLNLGSASECPLQNFPPDVNSNLYADVIDLALAQAPEFLLLIINLSIKHENPIMNKDVIRIAYLFGQFANSVNANNNVLKKIKSITLKCNGLTNEGLDSMAAVGATETSRAFRINRDFMASMPDEILKSYAGTMIAQFCFDNLDIQLNHQMHHLTLNYVEFEQTDTSALTVTDSKSFEEMKDLFSMETVLMQSDQNKVLLEHYKYIVANTLGRLFGKEIPEVRWMLDVFPKHYLHPNSSTACKKSLIHVDKPMYLQETKNR